MALINPYNELGLLHNAALDYIIAQNSSPTVDQFFDYSIDFYCDYIGKDTNAIRSSLRIDCGRAYNIGVWDDTVGYLRKDMIRNRFSFSGYQLPFLESILNPTLPVPPTYYLDLENDILSSPLLPTYFEQGILLGPCAVGKYSTSYWDDASTNPTNPWYDIYHGIANPGEVITVDMMALFLFQWTRLIGQNLVDGIHGTEASEDEMERGSVWCAWMAAMASGTHLIFG